MRHDETIVAPNSHIPTVESSKALTVTKNITKLCHKESSKTSQN